MFQLAIILLILTDSVRKFLFLKKPCHKTSLMIVEKMLLCFRSGKLLASIKEIKNSKEIAAIARFGSGTVQYFIIPWKDSGELSTLQKKWVEEKSWLILNGNHKNAWWSLILKSSLVELMAMYKYEGKSISMRTMLQEHGGLGLNSCVATRKPLICAVEKMMSACKGA